MEARASHQHSTEHLTESQTAAIERAEAAERSLKEERERLHQAERELAALRDSVAAKDTGLGTALQGERMAADEAAGLRADLSKVSAVLLQVQVEAQMSVSKAEREWSGRVQDAETAARDASERCRVAEEVAAGEAKAHSTLLARLASPMVWEGGRMVRQSAEMGKDGSAESNFLAPASPSRPYGGFE